MSQLLPVATVAVLALAAAAGARWAARKRGPVVDIGRLVDYPAIVVFTADHCVRCVRTLELVASAPLPVVQVKAEVDGRVMESLGVEAVPLTVVAGQGGRRIAQFGGVPPKRRLAGAVRRAANTARS